MNLEYLSQLPENFAPDSRVWIYQSSRLFSLGEALQLEEMLEGFAANWKSHGTPVKGYANLFFGQFVILMADESATGVSGCSTDSSVRLMKEIEQTFKVSLFDRQALAFVVKESVQLLPMNQLGYALEKSFISGDTLYFNNLVQTKQELIENWIIPVRTSWLAKKLNLTTSN